MTTPRKPKRKLSDISFDQSSSHIALVHANQGGPASGADYKLVIKNLNFSEEFIEKMQQIRVTLSVPDFLEKFFHLYGSDAEVLARMLGYVPEENDEEEYDSNWYENYIQEKLDSFEILKSLNESESIVNTLATLNEKQYLSMLTDQSFIEKALNKKESDLVVQASESDNSTHASVEKSVEVSTSEKTKSKDTRMTKEVKVGDTAIIEKAAMVSLQKALDEQSVELQKALDSLAVFEQEKQEGIIKSKTAQFAAVVKDEKLIAPILKAALALESQEDFTAFLGAITVMQVSVEKSKEALEKSALFNEIGATASEDEKPQESALSRILKAQNQSK